MIAVSPWWFGGWILGVVVVIVAATLLIMAIVQARRIVRQADEITAILNGTRENTNPMYDLLKTNEALERITRGLTTVREGRGR